MNSKYAVLASLFIFMACSDDGAPSGGKDTGASTKQDKGVGSDGVADKAVADTMGPACGPGIYPCGPYGMKAGDILENHKFQGFADPKDQCKDNKAKKLDMTRVLTLSPKTFHHGDTSCPTKKKQLLWIWGSAGWCGTCVKEGKVIQAAYENNQLDSRVALFNVLVDGTTVGGAPDEATSRAFLSTIKATFPGAYDAKRVLAKYFTASYFPLNMLVDLKTMKIYYVKNGDSVGTIGTKIAQFFK